MFRVIKCDTVTLQPLRHFTTGLCKMCDINEPGLLVVNAANFPKNNFFSTSKFPVYHGTQVIVDRSIHVSSVINSSNAPGSVEVDGDVFISTGDLISISDDRSYQFVDRLGDTFRWKSENVSTVEVGSVMSGACGVEECCVYGVLVPGMSIL